MAIKNVALPLLSGGAVLLGYAAFSWLRGKQSRSESNQPSTLRDAGLSEPNEREALAEQAPPLAPESDTGPLSERAPEFARPLELDLDFEEDRSISAAPAAPGHAPPARAEVGALFLALATDALSPFGAEFEHAHVLRDPFRAPREQSLRATSQPLESDERRSDAPDESERRPSAAGARS